MSPRWVVVVLLLLTATCGLLFYRNRLERAYRVARRSGRKRARSVHSGQKIHVCLCSDDKDLRPAAAAIKSAASNAAEPGRLVFHFVTTPEIAERAKGLFKEHLSGVRVEVHHDLDLQNEIERMITFRKTSKARRVLASSFNFAPFYLDRYIKKKTSPQRLIYIDTDTLILGDLAEMHDMDMQGRPCAAVKYCLQRWEDYINFDILKDLGYTDFDPKQCIANRGVLLIDVKNWNSQGITEKIEMWMGHYKNAKGDLWLGGMSQPPWLLAMNGNYTNLGDEWNCNGLGRPAMSMWESIALRKNGFDHKALRLLGVKFGAYGAIQPYVVTCSENAKLLHFNGDYKPWVADRSHRTPPACARPQHMVDRKWNWSADLRLFCEDHVYVRCPEVWQMFMPPEAECQLKDLDSEWAEEDRTWAEQKIADMEKAEKERKEKEEKMQQDKGVKDVIKDMEKPAEDNDKEDDNKEESEKKKKKKKKSGGDDD